ncbi:MULTISPECIES: hypothetical protein [unclassified Frankia]|uniref:hypothetical protein n=1 Tax=unclassified Frankia TaxID=2632575 RepID=UPI002AD4528D|nr:MULTISPECIES: hypothetical protein [unclassified Frankia]
MTQDKIIRDLAGVVGLVDKVEPFIELQDTATRDEAAREMRNAGVRYARVVHLEADLIRSSIITVADLGKVPDPARPLAGVIDTFLPEIFLDWRDFLTTAVNESLRDAPAGTTITVEDEGRPLGVIPATTIEAFINTGGG